MRLLDSYAVMIPATIAIAVGISMIPWTGIILFFLALYYYQKHVDRKEQELKESLVDTDRYDYSRVQSEYHISYREYLGTPMWKRLRAKVLDRDNHRCTICGDNENLNVHHDHYRGIHTMDFKMDQLRTLCEFHHESEHKN